MSVTKAIGRWLSSSNPGDPWPDRPHIATELLRDWWVAECWFHKSKELAEAHFEGFVQWATKQPPASLPYAPWSPFTTVRIDLSCLKDAPTPALQRQYGDHLSRCYVVAYCCARNDLREVDFYRNCWKQSDDYKPYLLMSERKKNDWPQTGCSCQPKWYYENNLKTVGSQWVEYRGLRGH